MKTKSFRKKLALNKKTIAHLSKKDMQHQHGGGYTWPITCTCTREPTCLTYKSCFTGCIPDTC